MGKNNTKKKYLSINSWGYFWMEGSQVLFL